MKNFKKFLIGFIILILIIISPKEIAKYYNHLNTNKDTKQTTVKDVVINDKKTIVKDDPIVKKTKLLKEFGLTDSDIKSLELDVKPVYPKLFYIEMRNSASSKVDGLVIVKKSGYDFKQVINNDTVIRMVNEAMNSNYEDKDYILSVLHMWLLNDFSKAREQYDFFYKKVLQM